MRHIALRGSGLAGLLSLSPSAAVRCGNERSVVKAGKDRPTYRIDPAMHNVTDLTMGRDW